MGDLSSLLFFISGAPPETIKDSMKLGLEIATNFVVVGEMFDRVTGINTAEVEFPVRRGDSMNYFSRDLPNHIRLLYICTQEYFNFFVRSRRMTVVCFEGTNDR